MFLNFFTPQIYKKTNYTNFFFSDLLKKIKIFFGLLNLSPFLIYKIY